MRKRKLIERIEQLEKVVEFLSNHNKDEIAVYLKVGLYGWRRCVIRYLYDGKLNEVQLGCVDRCEIVENNADYVIVKESTLYYKVDKKKATCEWIPKPAFVLEKELADKEASTKSSAKKSTEKKS